MDPKTQEDIDREQMIAGVELARELLQNSVTNGKLQTEEEKSRLMIQCKRLVLPERYKDISVDLLKELTLRDYITEASIKAVEFRETRKFLMLIKPQDSDLVAELLSHWEKKGFNCVLETITNTNTIELSW